MKFIKKNIVFLLAFFIPLLIMLLIYAVRGIFPFGDECYLRSDMYHQYAPFLQNFRTNILSGDSMLFDWNIGMGINYIPLYAYYLASPLNWLILLIPSSYVIEGMSLFILLKAGLMSTTFVYYLHKHFNSNHPVLAAFGIFYALSGYMAAFSWNIMWLDCLVLFPLIILGLERLIKDKKPILYIVTLGISIFSNYYIAIMICIFTIFYCIYLLVIHGFSLGKILRYAGSSLIAGGLGAVLWVPSFVALSYTASGSFSFPESLHIYFPFYEIISRGLINIEPAIFTAHEPNIYAGIFVFLLIPLYVMNKKLSLRERIGKICLLLLLFLGFNINIMDYIWHGFHFPNSLPARQSFIFIFLVLVLSFEAFTHLKDHPPKRIYGVFAGVVGLFFLFEILFKESENFSSTNIYLNILIITVYLIILALFRSSQINRGLLFYILFIAIIIESIINTNETALGTTNRTSYLSDNQEISSLINDVKEEDSSFYRIEKNNRRTKNDGSWHNYKNVSVFSSSASSGMTRYLSAFGFENSTNSYAFYGYTPITASMLSVKYILSDTEFPDQSPYPIYSKEDTNYLYENPYVLPLGVLFPENLDALFSIEGNNPFHTQNNFLQAATGVSDIFTEVPSSTMANDVVFTLTDTEHIYIYPYSNFHSIVIHMNNSETGFTDTKSYSSVNHTHIFDLGTLTAGTSVTITCNNKSGDPVNTGIEVVAFHKDTFEAAWDEINTQNFSSISYSDTYVSGKITASKNSLLLTSIPFDPGWTATIDGESIELTKFKDALIALKVPEGTHFVEFHFSPKGFFTGIIISGSSLLVLIILIIVLRIRGKSQKIEPVLEPEPDQEKDS